MIKSKIWCVAIITLTVIAASPLLDPWVYPPSPPRPQPRKNPCPFLILLTGSCFIEIDGAVEAGFPVYDLYARSPRSYDIAIRSKK